MSQPSPTIVVQSGGPGCLVRGLYFIFVGWWLTGIWLLVAWILNVTVVGLPFGLTMLNRVPQVMTLSPGSQKMHVQTVGDITMVTTGAQQLPMWVRVIYFVLIGWWASLVWTFAAYFISLTVVGLPVSFAMFNLVGLVTTLRKN
ncbi:MAG TPA: YccF domain-containing protein [Chloroflexia bacterium]|nr:YccF domain-containing protein [Chloroflexia bacterium]